MGKGQMVEADPTSLNVRVSRPLYGAAFFSVCFPDKGYPGTDMVTEML